MLNTEVCEFLNVLRKIAQQVGALENTLKDLSFLLERLILTLNLERQDLNPVPHPSNSVFEWIISKKKNLMCSIVLC